MSLVDAEAIVAGYGPREVLRGCDLMFDAGEVVSAVGPNGAGKSTLVRVLAGLLRPTAGRVRIRGRDVAMLARQQIAREIAVVPQAFEPLFPFTVREIVALGRTARLDAFGRRSRDDERAIADAISALELEALADRPIDGISGGERQRVVLAMALAQEAAVLLLDEPTVHLDPTHQLATMRLVQRLARERGLAVLAVVHDLNLAALADRVVVLADGRIVRDGTPLAVLDQTLVSDVFGHGWTVMRQDGRPVVVPAAAERPSVVGRAG